DAAALIEVRQAFVREGMSVSIAWDDKQAADLLEMVRPDIAIVDLTLPPRGGHRFVVEMAASEKSPVIVLVPGSEDPAAGFAAAAGAASARVRPVAPHELLVKLPTMAKRRATPSGKS